MTTKACGYKKHTPITSKKQAGFFGAEYKRGKEGKQKRTGMSQSTLKRHLEEYGGGGHSPVKFRKRNGTA